MFKTNIFDLNNNPPGGLEFDNVWVYTPGGSPKTNKDGVYTPMRGLPLISVMVYVLFGGSPKLKV